MYKEKEVPVLDSLPNPFPAFHRGIFTRTGLPYSFS